MAADGLSPEKAAQILAAIAEAYPSGLPSEVVFSPQEPTHKQAEFLGLTCFEALYGGAAGGGKSSALLLAALEHVDKPNYAAMLMRKSYRDLALPGALMDRAAEWLRPTAARWHELDKKWTFPSGASLTFGYLDTEADKYRYQGTEIQLCAVDELTQWTEAKYLYMLSRIRRSKGAEIPLRARAASNPGGIGHRWVKDRFVDSGHPGRVFVPARLVDNPHLDQQAYTETLNQLDQLTVRQLLYGEWVVDAHGLIYPYGPINLVDALPPGEWTFILAVDLGASVTRPTTAFCVVACSLRDPSVYVVESEKRALSSPGATAEVIYRFQERYDFAGVYVDQGGLGRGYIEEFQNRYHIPAEGAQQRNKLGYIRLMRGDMERGRVKVVTGANTGLLQEWSELPWNEAETDAAKGALDHLADAALYAYVQAYHYLHRPKEPGPPEGSSEAIEAKLLEEHLERVQGSGSRLPF